MSELKIAGFDPGRKYIAWGLVVGTPKEGFRLERHGLLYPPDLGSTENFGQSLPFWSSFFWTFVREDLEADALGVERFIYRPGGQGGGSEDINLRLPAMAGPSTFLIRNTDWKRWFKANVCAEGTQAYYGTPTEHEADSCGIAHYTSAVRLQP